MPVRRPRLGTIVLALTISLSAAAMTATRVAAVDVATFDEFLAAWQDPGNELVMMTTNITIECGKSGEANLERSAGGPILVDGAGFTLHNPCTGDALIKTGAGTVTLRNLRLTGNPASDDGLEATGDVVAEQTTIVLEHGDSGIDAGGSVTVDTSAIIENGAEGVIAGGAVTVTGSGVSLNGATGSDGISADGDVAVTRSTVHGNGGLEGGDGVEGATVTVVDSTIDGNAENGIRSVVADLTNATVHGNGLAGIFAEETIIANHATVTGNVVNLENFLLETIHLYASVVADAAQANCVALSVEDLGFNHVDDDTCGPVAQATEPHGLGELADNGGRTRTRLPGAGSPLIDAVPSADCGVAADQRGLTRPQGLGCDIGSVEVELLGETTPTPTATPTGSPPASQLPDTGIGAPAPRAWPSVATLILVFVASGLTLATRVAKRPRRAADRSGGNAEGQAPGGEEPGLRTQR